MSATLTANRTAGVTATALMDLVTAAQAANGKADERLFDAWTHASRTLADTAVAYLASDSAAVGEWVALPDGPLTVARVSTMFGVFLSEDGTAFSTEAWCTCGTPKATQRAERYALVADGTGGLDASREFHGYVCKRCGSVTQTG